jgi:hypothetical protein
MPTPRPAAEARRHLHAARSTKHEARSTKHEVRKRVSGRDRTGIRDLASRCPTIRRRPRTKREPRGDQATGASGQSGRPESNRHRRLGTPPPFLLGYDHELGVTTTATKAIRRRTRPSGDEDDSTPKLDLTMRTAGLEPASTTWHAVTLPLGYDRERTPSERSRSEGPAKAQGNEAIIEVDGWNRTGICDLASRCPTLGRRPQKGPRWPRPETHEPSCRRRNRRRLTVETGGLEPHTPGANRVFSH